MRNRHPSPWSTFNRILTAVTVVSVCITILAFLWTWQKTELPGESVKELGRAVIGIEQPRKKGVPPNEADAKDIAAAVAIDCEGERVDLIGKCWREVTHIILRAKQRLPHLSFRQIVAKALTWVPDKWKYPRRWRDRDTAITEMARSETVKDLVPSVMKWMEEGPDEGCAAKIVRAGWHWFGIAGGEMSAVSEIRTYPKDSRYENKGFLTDFRCLPTS